MNSSPAWSDGRLAIENERWWPSAPGIEMSKYWPGWNSTSCGSSNSKLSRRMSCVNSSTAATRVFAVTSGSPAFSTSSS